jgi:hypothetical protein
VSQKFAIFQLLTADKRLQPPHEVQLLLIFTAPLFRSQISIYTVIYPASDARFPPVSLIPVRNLAQLELKLLIASLGLCGVQLNEMAAQMEFVQRWQALQLHTDTSNQLITVSSHVLTVHRISV